MTINPTLPLELVQEVYTYLIPQIGPDWLFTKDMDQAIGLTARVCKAWNDAFKEERDAALQRMQVRKIDREYPYYSLIFHKNFRLIADLVDFKLSKRENVFTITPEDMTYPIMRAQDVQWGTPALYLLIEPKEGPSNPTFLTLYRYRSVKDPYSGLTIDYWKMKIERASAETFEWYSETAGIKPAILEQLITDSHPTYKLAAPQNA